MLAIHLRGEIERRLADLARRTGRTKTFHCTRGDPDASRRPAGSLSGRRSSAVHPPGGGLTRLWRPNSTWSVEWDGLSHVNDVTPDHLGAGGRLLAHACSPASRKRWSHPGRHPAGRQVCHTMSTTTVLDPGLLDTQRTCGQGVYTPRHFRRRWSPGFAAERIQEAQRDAQLTLPPDVLRKHSVLEQVTGVPHVVRQRTIAAGPSNGHQPHPSAAPRVKRALSGSHRAATLPTQLERHEGCMARQVVNGDSAPPIVFGELRASSATRVIVQPQALDGSLDGGTHAVRQSVALHHMELDELESEPAVVDVEGIEHARDGALSGVHHRAGQPVVAPLVDLIPPLRPGNHVATLGARTSGNVETQVRADSVVRFQLIARCLAPVRWELAAGIFSLDAATRACGLPAARGGFSPTSSAMARSPGCLTFASKSRGGGAGRTRITAAPRDPPRRRSSAPRNGRRPVAPFAARRGPS